MRWCSRRTLPSTGATSHNNYMNLVISNHNTFSSTWLGSFAFDASGLHLTEARNSDLGFALAFPFSSTSSTISGFETFGDNQFVTPITAFPVLRNQEKYQFRYDVSHATGRHAPRFGIDFIHEPVLSGALAGNAGKLCTFPEDPTIYLANSPISLRICTADYATPEATRHTRRERKLLAKCAAAGLLCGGFLAGDVAAHRELWFAIRHHIRTCSRRRARARLENPALLTLQGAADSVWSAWRAAGLS